MGVTVYVRPRPGATVGICVSSFAVPTVASDVGQQGQGCPVGQLCSVVQVPLLPRGLLLALQQSCKLSFNTPLDLAFLGFLLAVADGEWESEG